MKNRLLIVLLFLGAFSQIKAQEIHNRAHVDYWISKWSISDGSKKDSMLLWSQKLMEASEKLNYPKAEAYSYRYLGLYHDFSGNIAEATENYLKFYQKSKENRSVSDELSAVSDLVYIYTLTNQNPKSKSLILNTIGRKDLGNENQKKIATFYNNLGIIYKKEHKVDSALMAYNKSLEIRQSLNDESGMANLRINMASLYINQKDYSRAEKLIDANLNYLDKHENKSDLWYNLVNKAGALEGQKKYTESIVYLERALSLARALKSVYFEQQTYESLSSLYANIQNFKKAYELLLESNKLNESILNEETNQKIAELQEQHNAVERERENQLLSSQLLLQKNKQVAYLIGLLALAALSAVVGFALRKNKRKNSLISAQNQKLSELNKEKNHLMSVVSHDLSSPFTAIKLWAESLDMTNQSDLKEAKVMILKTTDFGLKTIKKVLTIDKNELQHIEIVQTDIADLTKDLLKRFEPIAASKNIAIKTEILQKRESIFTDKSLLFRALENLLSNAIKYSDTGKTVFYKTFEENGKMHFQINDNGKGISEENVKWLFDKYSTTDNKPTAGEASSGLGLNIVKRIAEELGGDISVKSELGKGSSFTFSVLV